jgi:hypothetical protein
MFFMVLLAVHSGSYKRHDDLKEFSFLGLLCTFVPSILFSFIIIICLVYGTQPFPDFLLKIINFLLFNPFLAYTGAASFPGAAPAIALLFKNPAVNLMNLKMLLAWPALLIFVGFPIWVTFDTGRALVRKTIVYLIG